MSIRLNPFKIAADGGFSGSGGEGGTCILGGTSGAQSAGSGSGAAGSGIAGSRSGSAGSGSGFAEPCCEGALALEYKSVPWNRYGRILSERPSFTLDPLFHAGCYYVQDSSAMFVGHLVRKALDALAAKGEFTSGRAVRVLDLCAAPGGKTTDIATSLRERFGDGWELVSNEVMKARAAVLRDNVAAWGDPNVVVTSADPAAFKAAEGYFDLIVADVPCSGEGMFRKDQRAVDEWSEALVEMCAARQKRILADVWPALRKGGVLVYSTCTYESAENDDNLLWLASEFGGSIVPPEDEFGEYGVELTSCGSLLRAGVVPGEGQWAGMLIKQGGSEPAFQARGAASGSAQTAFWRTEATAASKGADEISRAGKRGASLREGKEFPKSGRRASAEGSADASSKKATELAVDPNEPLGIGFDRTKYPLVELDKATALKYLHRDALVLPQAQKGLNVVCYCGQPLGFVKNVGTRCNNLLPKGRRILIDV